MYAGVVPQLGFRAGVSAKIWIIVPMSAFGLKPDVAMRHANVH
jgi:hypothetical protein